MSNCKDKRLEACLQAGQIDGDRLEVEAEFDEGVTVKKTVTGELSFIPGEFLQLLLLRQRGQNG